MLLALWYPAAAQKAGDVLPPWAPGELDIHHINTGKGDSIYFIFPDGTTMLANAGTAGRKDRVTPPRPDGSRRPGEWIGRYIRHMAPAGAAPQLDYVPRRDFEIRNLVANGAVWTGKAVETRQLFPPLEKIARQDWPDENMCSAGFVLRYGKFDYFRGGDIPGVPAAGAPKWHDVETPVAEVAGPVDVNMCDHHAYQDTQNATLVAALRPRVHVISVWAPSHPGALVLARLLSTRLYPGPRDVFATNLMEATREVIGASLDNLKANHGHIVVRVAPGGASYRVLVLDDSAETWRVLAVHGPYESR